MSLFRSHTKISPPSYTGLQLQAASSAIPVPILYGTTRVAPNIVWSGAFQVVPRYSTTGGGGKGGLFGGGSGKSTSITYDYRTALVLGLCEGPVGGIGTVFHDQGTYSMATLGLGLLPGTSPQAAWAYLGASFPGQALGYPGTALVVASSFDLGGNASIGNLAFEVSGVAAGSAVNGVDADPAIVLGDMLTNAQYGVGFPAASISGTALYGASGDGSYQTYCRALGLGLSPCLADQESARSILSRYLQLTNSTAVWSSGLLKIVPFGDAPVSGSGFTFQPNLTPIYDLADDDFLVEDGHDPVVVTRTDPYSTPNVQRLEVLNRAPTYASGLVGATANYYSPTPVEARDQNAIELYGLRVGSTISAHEICDIGIASVSAQLILQRALYVRNTYAFRLSWEYCLLEPMDLVTLTDNGLGLAKAPVRIIAIEEDTEGLLAVTAEEFPGTVATTSGYAVDGAASPAYNRSIAPAAVNPPVILEPPADLTGGVPQLWLGLSGGTNGVADPNWGGAVIYASTDNTTYSQVGTVDAPARQGVVTAALGAPPGSPADVLTVSFVESGATIVAGATPTQIVVDGEIMSFTTATLTGVNTYRLGGLTREIYGRRGGPHAVGAQALILDTSIFTYALPAALIGTPLWFKFASFNIFGGTAQDLSTCVAYQTTPVGSGVFGPVSQSIAGGQSFDEALASQTVTENDDDGIASDPYTDVVDMGLASDGAATLAVQSGGTGAATPAAARGNIGAAAAGANADITSLSALTAATIGKVAVTDTAAITYTSGGSGRALAGLLGSDRYRVSVSASGASFVQALDIDPTTGHVGLAGYTADSNNALGVLGTSFLFNAAVDSCRFTFNKAATANDASLTFETGFSARALAGLLGSDGFQLKVSPDGSAYYQVFVTDQTTGNAAFKALLSVASYSVASLPAGLNGALAFAYNGRKLGEAAGGGTGVVVAFSNGQWRRLSDDSVVAA